MAILSLNNICQKFVNGYKKHGLYEIIFKTDFLKSFDCELNLLRFGVSVDKNNLVNSVKRCYFGFNDDELKSYLNKSGLDCLDHFKLGPKIFKYADKYFVVQKLEKIDCLADSLSYGLFSNPIYNNKQLDLIGMNYNQLKEKGFFQKGNDTNSFMNPNNSNLIEIIKR